MIVIYDKHSLTRTDFIYWKTPVRKYSKIYAYLSGCPKSPWFMAWAASTPFNNKKVTQHDFDQLYFFNHGFIFSCVRFHWKACLFAFLSMLYLLFLFRWGIVGWVNGGQCQHEKFQNLIDFKKVVFHGSVSDQSCVVDLPKSVEFQKQVRFCNISFLKLPTHWYNWLKLSCNFAIFNFWHCPQFSHPVHISVKQSKQIRYQWNDK